MAASERIIQTISSLNQHIESTAPWRLARRPEAAQQLSDLLESYVATLQCIARAIEPITPELSRRTLDLLDADPTKAPQPLYTRLHVDVTRHVL